jgi:hypothetical protein
MMRSFITLYVSQNKVRVIKARRMNAWERREMRTNFLSEYIKGRDHAEGTGVAGR